MIRMLVRRMLQRVGYDIVKYHPTYQTGRFDELNLQGEFGWLKDFHFNTIIDIGGNEGQFADKMHALFPQAIIYSFEPIQATFKRLQKNFANNPQVRCINLALGEAPGELSFNVNESTASSSFLEMSDVHKKSFDFAVKVEPVVVKLDTLDNVISLTENQLPLLIKIDVQGFEDKVIKGGLRLLKDAAMVICEVSFTELYKEQPLFHDIYDLLHREGFAYAGNMEQLRSPDTNRILQADAIFIKT